MSNESINNTISLMLITVVAGLLLGVVYEVTKEPIAAEQLRAKEEAYKAVFAEAETFGEMSVDTNLLNEIKEKQGINATVEEVMEVLDQSGNFAGYVLTVTDHEGYGGDVQFAMGIKSDGTLNGISFLSLSETAGLGMKANEEGFKIQFAGKNVQSFRYTKNGAVSEDEIDALSGATITTNAVVNGVNAGLYYVQHLEEYEGRMTDE